VAEVNRKRFQKPRRGAACTVAAFEAWHALQEERWEFVEGRPRLMAPASMRHSIIKRNVFRALDQGLAGSGCEALIDGPQILTEDISAIPDVVVTCAPLDLTTPVIAAPAIIAEVMSPSTAGDDHGLKWLSYRKIASLNHYIIIAQHQRLVHAHSRMGDLWRERFVSAGSIALDDPSVTLELDALYAATDIAA
jgi:Uma2 family endonuclease